MDIDKLRPIDFAEISKAPTFFIHAMKDELIPYKHTIQLYEKYGGKKSINIVEGNHNSLRQKHLITKIIHFFCNYLNENKNEKVNPNEIKKQNKNDEEKEEEKEEEEDEEI
jgi:fermentation-respiration switch protein FrsA (DUF1100 family)